MFLLCKQTTGPVVESGQSKKILAVSGDYSSLQRILKEAFEIDREIIIQKYEADWEDFVDLLILLMSRTGGEL